MSGLPPNDYRSAPITVNTANDGSGTELRVLCDSSGRIITVPFVTGTDSGTLATGQSMPINISVAYGYDSVNTRNQRIAVNSLGQVGVYTP